MRQKQRRYLLLLLRQPGPARLFLSRPLRIWLLPSLFAITHTAFSLSDIYAFTCLFHLPGIPFFLFWA